MKRLVALIIRDGWGVSPTSPDRSEPRFLEAAQKEGNSTLLAKTPFHDQLYATYPQSRLSACGLDVGLPEGQMGNSEVGHLNLGAGRIVFQDLTRINQSIKKGDFFQNGVLVPFLESLRKGGKALHLCGLLSNGGVHSHQEHLHALLRAAKEQGLSRVYLHLFMDGRDTSPTAGAGYVEKLQAEIGKIGVGAIATVVGRYYAMDRDHRWERTQLAYDLMFSGVGKPVDDPVAALKECYAEGKTDEFIPALVVAKEPRPLIADGDGLLFFNFRSDRARQLSQAVLEKDFKGFPRTVHPAVTYITLTEYDATYGVPTLFPPQGMTKILGEVVSAAGKTQVRMAETEKYPHVTYFFNGGVETPYPGEDREVVPSPKVATYDLQPQMSAPELTEKALARIQSGNYDLMILNFANTDMVGHTGILSAAVEAVETIDRCVHRLLEAILAQGGCALVTADHGNCERMIAEDGTPHTAHTTNLVHFLYVGADHDKVRLKDGILADVAPTLLDLLGVPQPPEMTGHSLVERV
ncbi:MAG: 2,3-bisphosphoglycerate-independent phosphoglycerate mutase [Verrucomicrobium sp.]|nr:2,3-bisphosphoglycerate-independent phosphoglycerate mutase [Verrucomicrobium sp.]